MKEFCCLCYCCEVDFMSVAVIGFKKVVSYLKARAVMNAIDLWVSC